MIENHQTCLTMLLKRFNVDTSFIFEGGCEIIGSSFENITNLSIRLSSSAKESKIARINFLKKDVL